MEGLALFISPRLHTAVFQFFSFNSREFYSDEDVNGKYLLPARWSRFLNIGSVLVPRGDVMLTT